MGTRHVTDLLSAAYDGALSAAEQRHYDEHLATCADCATGAEHFRQAIDAVHALPRARMPQRVVLPATPPQPERPERRRITVPAWLRRLPRPALSPAWGAGTLAAAGIVAAVLAVHGSFGGSHSLTAGSAAPQQRALVDGGAGGGANSAAVAGIGTCPLPLAVVPQPASLATAPKGFTHAAVTTVPQRPGETLVLSTTTTRVSAGEQVLIYAALTTSGGTRKAVIPCVTLHDQGALALGPQPQADRGAGTTAGSAAGAPAASPVANGSTTAHPPAAAGLPAENNGPNYSSATGTVLTPQQVEAFAPYSLLPPLAEASPTSAAVATLPLQVVQIPRDALPGTFLQLVALVPSGLPASGDQPAVEAVLTLEVS
jgi:Putative zinc-finger